MKHTMVTFRLHRKGVVLLGVGAFLVGVLLFAAGYLLASRGGKGIETASVPVALPKASLPKPAMPSIAVPRRALPAAASRREEKESAATPHISDEAFALRVGAFMEESDAKAFVEALAARGYEPAVTPVTTQDGGILHTVLIGRYASRDEAAAAAAELEKKEELSCAVVPASRAASKDGIEADSNG